MNLHPKLIELLENRGITQENMEEFLSDKPKKTYDPFLLLNMEAGVDLILSSIENDEKICIYGDYDADGVTATTLLMEVLSHLTDNLTYYIPSRFDEGYGLNQAALDKIKEANVDLVITVDCGSVSYDEVEHAKEIGLKILVTDHHTIASKQADCLIINPMQPECTYPFKNLAGVGVAFKLAQAIAGETGLPKSVVNRTLDLVGIGTIGDIVPLVDENRTLAKYGLRAINVSERPGLANLIEGVSLKQGSISSENVSFAIVPHINAAGRMESATIASRLLMAPSREKTEGLVKTVVSCNQKRKKAQEDTFEICKQIVAEKYLDDLFLLLELDDAHEGVTGIVAGKIKDTFGKPAVIVTPTGEEYMKGTGRSITGINLYKLLSANEDLFVKFGGHSAACGFTIKKENISLLRENLNKEMKSIYEENPNIFDCSPKGEILLNAEDITLDFVRDQVKLEPFGCSNPRPLISVLGHAQRVRSMGNKGQYRAFNAVLDNGRELSCVIFAKAEEFDKILSSGQKLCITGALSEQNYNGRTYIQMRVVGIEGYYNGNN